MTAIAQLLAGRKLLSLVEAADSIGIFTELTAGPMTTAHLAVCVDVRPELLESLLRVLSWNGMVTRTVEGWSLLPPYDIQLLPGLDRSLVPLLRVEKWAHGSHLNAQGIVAALRGQRRPTEIPDQRVADLADAMFVGSRASAPYLARVLELRECRSLVDVAGGSGGYAVSLCRSLPRLSVTVLDRPQMLPHAERTAATAGLADRIRLMPWDLHTDAVPEHDSALVSHVLHLLTREERVDLLVRVAAALPAGGVLLVHDFCYDDPAPASPLGASAIDWLSTGAGYALTSDESRAELAEAGFRLDRSMALPTAGTHLMVAHRAAEVRHRPGA